MTPLPSTVMGLIEELEAQYPPRCYTPVSEDIETHLIYAGKVALIARLRERAEAADRNARTLPSIL